MQKWLVLCFALLALVLAEECPDRGECEDGHTCCKAPADGYECCPLHQAECCGDHKHCCPEATTCVVDESTCVNATVTLPWVERVSAKPSGFSKSFRMIKSFSGDEDDNICPDASHCPAEFSCLRRAQRGYGCCPLAQAVPCPDGKHCCPESHQCSEDGGSCIQQQKAQPVSAVMCSDAEHECPDETTCCQTAGGSWACCPMPKAVCCEDMIHCCPEETTCDIQQSKCISSTNKQMPMWAKFPARKRADWENENDVQVTATAVSQHAGITTTASTSPFTRVGSWVPAKSWKSEVRTGDVTCDSRYSCPDQTSCCMTATKEWACCPLPEAVCCEDHEHCCPHGSTCDMTTLQCDTPTGPVPMVRKAAIAYTSLKYEDAGTESYGWVPDKSGKAEFGAGDVICDSSHSCPDQTTCCMTATKDWACCPMPEAVCCDDLIHCCPHGKKCNLPLQTCDDPLGSAPWLEKIPAKSWKAEVGAGDVTCDSSHSCPDQTTCCVTSTGDWACCPLPEAVCCEDHEHCCPHGSTCDLTTLSCDTPTGPVPMVKKVAAHTTLEPEDAGTETPGWVPDNSWKAEFGAGDVICDSSHSCPDQTTCCMTATKDWACCPMPEAVCCDDLIHCCPHGKKCNLPLQTCDDPLDSAPWLEKIPAKSWKAEVGAGDVTCDSSHSCPDQTTCCVTSTGDWACCPLPEAVCCEDHEHCCPHGSTCDLTTLSCDTPTGPVPMVKKVAAHTTLEPEDAGTETPGWVPDNSWKAEFGAGDVICDSSHSCPDQTTCCMTTTKDWACCPMPEAVCCDDLIHCCPHGKKCNLPLQTCDDPLDSAPWLEKIPAKSGKAEVGAGDVTCDSSHSCPDQTTCCVTSTGDWACCPLPEAVCCEDHEHCCPHGSTCDLTTLSCDTPTGPVPMVRKVAAHTTPEPEDAGTESPGGSTAATKLQTQDDDDDDDDNDEEEQDESVRCDTHTVCPRDTTCCFMLSSQKWGCCPLPNAVCCADGEHCCPADYTCSANVCAKGGVVIPWYNKLAAEAESRLPPPTSAPLGRDVHCGGTFSCKDGETCCKTLGLTWGCCPEPNAVCCGDMLHCCPAGYTCDAAGNCNPSKGFGWDYWQVMFANKKKRTL